MSVNWISPKQFSELKDDILCLDIRSEQEHLQSHIPGSCLVGQHNIALVPNESLLIYCQSGIRTEMLSKTLEARIKRTFFCLKGG
ncbi:rhodanese-like domain-containing protein [Endozoicomonas arenosclerae]|uniref:rhodanese-like domain-containing protein n=1 Tax=Endozoicomonas arenosclerae TaxID=1633495 RepID=UPI00078263D1|nr:rhodanese-like domain-containing protein [Endozoicomonas arenosclerae]